MDIAIVAVVGTLLGVVVTAAAGLLTSALTARHQRATAERALAHAADDRRRTERRDIFVDYLAAYSDVREKILAHNRSRDTASEADAGLSISATGRRRAARVEVYAPDEAARFSEAYQTLRITSTDKTGEAAKDCTSRLWALAELSAKGSQEEFDKGWEELKESRRTLRLAMREEIGASR